MLGQTFTIVAPVFVLIGIGYALAKFQVLKESAVAATAFRSVDFNIGLLPSVLGFEHPHECGRSAQASTAGQERSSVPNSATRSSRRRPVSASKT